MSQPPSHGHNDAEATRALGGSSRLESTGIQAGALLGSRFQIEAVIGEGGSGQVFRAWDRVLGEPVALKILRPDRAREKSWIKRLAREVKVARAIRHPNVCRVFELGNVGQHWFVSMELASGGTLRQELRTGGQRPMSELLADARSLCAGLAAIHTVGITHRDVTPQNVLRMADGRLVLSDFGLAIEGGITTVHGGTPSYMAPETAMRQRPDQRSDVWQLGFVLHELIFGLRPEWAPGRKGIAFRDPARPGASALHRELARLCRDCLAANPADSPASAIEVSARLVALNVGASRTMLGRLTGGRPLALICSAGLVCGLAWLVVGHTGDRPIPRSTPPELSPADRQLLKSIADRLKSQGRLDDARSLSHMAGL